MAFALGQFPAAIKGAETVIAAAPHHPQAFKLLGAIHETTGDKESARNAYQLALHADANDVETWIKLGILLRCDCAA